MSKKNAAGKDLSLLEQTALQSQRKFEALRGKGFGGLASSGARDVRTDLSFASGTVETLDSAFKVETIGLKTKDEFVETKKSIAERLEEERRRRERQEQEQLEQERERKRKAREAELAQKTKLSFFHGEEERDDGAAEPVAAAGGADDGAPGPSGAQAEAAAAEGSTRGPGEGASGQAPAAPAQGMSLAERLKLAQSRVAPKEASVSGSELSSEGGPRKRTRIIKNPSVRTDYLPDRERQEQEAELRERLKREWQEKQEAIKNEPLEMKYLYWDGNGHGSNLVIRKGDTIGSFLAKAKEQLAPQFRDLASVGASSLMYVKDDFIIPHDLTFYDLIMKRVDAPGKDVPLFRFHDQEFQRVGPDGRKRPPPAEGQAKLQLGKVVERGW